MIWYVDLNYMIDKNVALRKAKVTRLIDAMSMPSSLLLSSESPLSTAIQSVEMGHKMLAPCALIYAVVLVHLLMKKRVGSNCKKGERGKEIL